MKSEHIPNYGLYGETRDSAAEIGIHIEEIAERSAGQNWVIKPHRHGKLFQVLCIFDGEAGVELDGSRHQIDGWSLVTIPIGVVHGFSFKPDSQGVVITLSDEILAAIFQRNDADYLRSLFESANVIDMNSEDEQRRLLQQYITLMRYEFTAANDAKFVSLQLLINLFLITIKRQIDHQSMDTSIAEPHLKTVDALRRLIEKHFKEQWQVTQYAHALNISTSTLNRMCHESLGAGAKSIILWRVVVEAKRRLTYTQQPLDQIAYYLGFKDPAYFSRLFKKSENISPSEYRKTQQL
ncbi:MAG: helix-turn-helix domain-containing protein [Halioglobus sp.]